MLPTLSNPLTEPWVSPPFWLKQIMAIKWGDACSSEHVPRGSVSKLLSWYHWLILVEKIPSWWQWEYPSCRERPVGVTGKRYTSGNRDPVGIKDYHVYSSYICVTLISMLHMLRTTHVATMMLFLSQLDVESDLNLTNPTKRRAAKGRAFMWRCRFHASKCRDQTHMHLPEYAWTLHDYMR